MGRKYKILLVQFFNSLEELAQRQNCGQAHLAVTADTQTRQQKVSGYRQASLAAVDNDFSRVGLSQAVDRPLWLLTTLEFWANPRQILNLFLIKFQRFRFLFFSGLCGYILRGNVSIYYIL